MPWGRGTYGAGGDPTQEALQSAADYLHKREQEARLQQQQDQSVKAQVLAAYLSHPSADNAALLNQFAPDINAQYHQTGQEQFSDRVFGHLNSTYDPNKPLDADPVAVGIANPDIGKAVPAMHFMGRRYEYQHAGQLPQGDVAAQMTEDKLIPTGNENAVNAETNRQNVATLGETNRHNVAEEGQTGPLRTAEAYKYGQEGQHAAAQTGLVTAQTKQLNQVNSPQSLDNAASMLAQRVATLDDYDKKQWPALIQQTQDRFGVIPAKNAQERDNLVQADTYVKLLGDRAEQLKKYAGVLDDPRQRTEFQLAMAQPEGTIGKMAQSRLRANTSPEVLHLVNELNNFREDVVGVRKFLGNIPMRSDKQMNIMLSPIPGQEVADAKDFLGKLDAFAPTAAMIRRNQVGGQPDLRGITPQWQQQDQGVTTTPDGLKWRKNPDGSMTQVP